MQITGLFIAIVVVVVSRCSCCSFGKIVQNEAFVCTAKAVEKEMF